MARLKGVVCSITNGQTDIVLEDGTHLAFPLDKLPAGISKGTFLTISIKIDHLAALLNNTPARHLLPKGQSS